MAGGENVPGGLTIFASPRYHRRRLRTSKPIERAIRQGLEHRAVKVRVFPNDASLECLVGAVLAEIDERWADDTRACNKWECQDA